MQKLLLFVALGLSLSSALAQNAPVPAGGTLPGGGRDSTAGLKRDDKQATKGNVLTMFPHSDTTAWFLAGQENTIFQAHPPFHSPYEGTNSMQSRGEYKTSLLGTLYTAYEPQRLLNKNVTERNQRFHTDLIFDLEATAGRGISQALGIAGFTNLDVVRNPNLGSAPYIARVEIHQTIGFTNTMIDSVRNPLSLATKVPMRRLEMRVGKMSLPDLFDLNDVGSDSHLQFTNWTIDNNGAWDYAADTRGYTSAVTLEYQDRNWALRYGFALMPTVANGIKLDWDLGRAHGQNAEFEFRHSLLPGKQGTQRVLAYFNNAHMGNYREAVNAYLNGTDATPQITLHEHFGALKYGFGYNTEEIITDHLRLFGRFGWNEGQQESFAYTEVDQTVSVGGDYNGERWRRKNDKVGAAFVSNAIKRDHQNYLADGGLGFILGDGHLRYGRENILETYYNAHAYRGLYFAWGNSFIRNPGYNRDRGPIWVPSIRAHVDF